MSDVLCQRGPPDRSAADYRAVAAIAGIVYFVMIGDAASRETHPIGLVVNAAIAAGVVTFYVLRAPSQADWFDLAILTAAVMLALGAMFSAFPRQSFDSVLGILAFTAALFLMRGIMARRAAREILVVAFLCLSVVLTLVGVVKWLVPYLQWWSLADWRITPPLGMNLSAEPWGHRHDLALLLAMLYPAWWMGRMTAPRIAVAIAIGLVDLILIVIGGSRMVWLALIVATGVIGVPALWRSNGVLRRYGVLAAGLVLALTATVAIAGATSPFVERVAGGPSLAERTAMWGPLVDLWTQRPLFGWGLGSFPWTLQATGYFDTHSFSPRHPDSAIVQLLAEAGILGIAALGVVVVAVALRLRASESRAATWAVMAFGVAALAGNPSDFDFMVVTAIAWLALAVPRRKDADSKTRRAPHRPVRVMSLVLTGIVGLSFAITVGAAVAYYGARQSIAAGRMDDAVQSLRVAAALDPGLAIYPRELGTLLMLTGHAATAAQELRTAVRLNPNDDLAWRTLGLALSAAGENESAREAIAQAVAVQRSDPSNLLLALRAQLEGGDRERARSIAAEIVQAWPEVVLTPSWNELSGGAGVAEIADLALDRWREQRPSPEPLFAQPLMLRALTGHTGELPEAGETRLDEALSRAYLAVMSCDPESDSAMAAVSEEDRRTATYAALATRLAGLQGTDDRPAARMFTVMSGDGSLESGRVPALIPLNENGARGSSVDRWGYRRPTIVWPSSQWDLPSPTSGFVLWHRHPERALEAAHLQEALPNCQ